MDSNTIEVQITTNTDRFCEGMAKATQALKDFKQALQSIPWYVRWLLAARAVLGIK